MTTLFIRQFVGDNIRAGENDSDSILDMDGTRVVLIVDFLEVDRTALDVLYPPSS